VRANPYLIHCARSSVSATVTRIRTSSLVIVHEFGKPTVKSRKTGVARRDDEACTPCTKESDRGRIVGGNVRNFVTDSPRSCTFPSAVRRVRRTRVQPTARDKLAVVASIIAYLL
jgi:hypothetical protein